MSIHNRNKRKKVNRRYFRDINKIYVSDIINISITNKSHNFKPNFGSAVMFAPDDGELTESIHLMSSDDVDKFMGSIIPPAEWIAFLDFSRPEVIRPVNGTDGVYSVGYKITEEFKSNMAAFSQVPAKMLFPDYSKMSATTISDIDEYHKNNYNPRMREILEEVVNKTAAEFGINIKHKIFRSDIK